MHGISWYAVLIIVIKLVFMHDKSDSMCLAISVGFWTKTHCSGHTCVKNSFGGCSECGADQLVFSGFPLSRELLDKFTNGSN